MNRAHLDATIDQALGQTIAYEECYLPNCWQTHMYYHVFISKLKSCGWASISGARLRFQAMLDCLADQNRHLWGKPSLVQSDRVDQTVHIGAMVTLAGITRITASSRSIHLGCRHPSPYKLINSCDCALQRRDSDLQASA